MTQERRKKIRKSFFVVLFIGFGIYFVGGLMWLSFYMLLVLSLVFAATRNAELNIGEILGQPEKSSKD